jgi:hypothetical protein
MKHLLLSFLITLVPVAAFADDSTPFGFEGGASIGLGSMKNKSLTIPGRTMDTFGLHVMPEYKFNSSCLLGLRLEYDFVGQRTEPTEVLGQNIKGRGYLLGLALQHHMDAWLFTAGFDFLGKYSQSLQTVSSQDTSYSKALGFRIGVGYYFLPNWTADAGAQMTWYSRNNLAGAAVDISSDKFRQSNYSLGVSYHY